MEWLQPGVNPSFAMSFVEVARAKKNGPPDEGGPFFLCSAEA
jgi:hypothetical protein